MIVADASWIIALRDPRDTHHVDATAINTAIGDETVLLHPVTLAECLVAPAKLGVAEEAAAAVRAAFEITNLDPGAPIRWATLRAETNLRLPDVIVLDTAIHHGAGVIATFGNGLAATAAERNIDVLGTQAA